ncbi:D-arabinose 1-dehydrogenase (NAD(P)(+)) ARA2 KNAG_0M02340 [Huiozyma naganishii CBS 8797]|uniref:NADP-dependent oxidoreductase domain-containing protein n=1 Tax=Huiozyma naganishii (strain ATCC MYA-139 / BCRC 22969 / CBS 8797 / KCTC 17520 / NBRC 10181 / NCYC 3082 / Yp74L-3) TaxID=1071383 RepID=J7S4A4_HUIN7|nr:hypothetical protein KNAG_0M02340 [Kazachstania naganishii CBS 8797]CCK73087.1 hypothetical protein KNAG_0M02340 [Kazachstania naganishii CBS 8797]
MKLSPLICGGATFSKQYNEDPESLPVVEILRKCLITHRRCFNAVDTSPYYGDSELLVGQALRELQIPRGEIYVCTKVGRVGVSEFDYSRENVRMSVMRSVERLVGEGGYLDVVYLHDVEFQPQEACLAALDELQKLKRAGIVRNVGVSGYPLSKLYSLVSLCYDAGTPLDCVLSYCHMNLQNVMLEEYYAKFKSKGVQHVVNASVLSMSLLRSQKTLEFHPGSPELKRRAQQAATLCSSQGVELADLATQFALEQWSDRGPTVIGFSTPEEVTRAASNLAETTAEHTDLVHSVQHSVLGDLFNTEWPSG